MKYSKLTDVGKVRKNNEDRLGLWEDLGLFVVADGMGGHQAGEIASQMAVDTLESYFSERNEFKPEETKELLKEAIEKANEKIYLKAHQHKELRGMGTTITTGYLWNNQLVIGQIGDSRAYRIDSKEIVQLTEDHSLVNELLKKGGLTEEEALKHPQKNVLTRALGVDINIETDIYEYILKDGDSLLFCTDGLSGMVKKEEMKEIILKDLSIDKKAQELVNLALTRGGNDNISLILLEV